MRPSLGNSAGFTLTELLMAAAILGIMAAFAVPSYNSYVARGRQQQAKVFLVQGYTQEQLFFTETTTFSLCLAHIGFKLSGEKSLYYEIGFEGFANGPSCGPNGNVPNCDAYKFDVDGNVTASCMISMGEDLFYNTACAIPSYCGPFGAGITPIAGLPRLGRDNFRMGACGSVSTSSNNPLDCWTIDTNRALVNNVPGI